MEPAATVSKPQERKGTGGREVHAENTENPQLLMSRLHEKSNTDLYFLVFLISDNSGNAFGHKKKKGKYHFINKSDRAFV